MIEKINNAESGKSVREKLNKIVERINKEEEQNTNYELLENKPMIDGVILSGNKTIADIGVEGKIEEKIEDNNKNYYTKEETQEEVEKAINRYNTQIETKIDNIEAGVVDLSDYATKEELQEEVNQLRKQLTNMTDKEIKQMAFREASTNLWLTDVRGFDFDTSKITINGLVKYPTIDYVKVDDITIQLKDYKLEAGDVVVMEAKITK